MNNGNVNNDNKDNNNYVWPVRGGEWTSCAPDVQMLFSDLYKSWKRCRKMKRNTVNALRFEYRAELNLLNLAEELASGSYRPSRVIRFVVDRPKLREIVAADFRDRIVHHYLVERLEQIYEPVFIHDSYACRVGKGVHQALARTRRFMRAGTANNTRPLYALHLDVKNYFMTIDKRILARLLEERLVKEARKLHHSPSCLPLSFLYRLSCLILQHEPMDCRIDKGNKQMLRAVPPHKSLLYAPPGVGLAVGNLTSQFFANVYLNELDQYCKHTLKCRYYLRYCDDFLILDSDPARLETIRESVRHFLKQRLKLELNTRYAAITDVRNGVDFIGYIIRPGYTLVRRRSVNNLKDRLERLQRSGVRQDAEGLYRFHCADKAWFERVRSVTASYYGHFKWADTIRLRRSIFRRYPWLHTPLRLNRSAMPILRRTVQTDRKKLYLKEKTR